MLVLVAILILTPFVALVGMLVAGSLYLVGLYYAARDKAAQTEPVLEQPDTAPEPSVATSLAA